MHASCTLLTLPAQVEADTAIRKVSDIGWLQLWVNGSQDRRTSGSMLPVGSLQALRAPLKQGPARCCRMWVLQLVHWSAGRLLRSASSLLPCLRKSSSSQRLLRVWPMRLREELTALTLGPALLRQQAPPCTTQCCAGGLRCPSPFCTHCMM